MADKVMLNFKYGIFSRLPEEQVPGTVYVTADEKAMYVDLPAVTAADGSTIEADRIRVSQIIIKNSYRDAKPPFSEDAFYYFEEENALLKWDPTGGDDGSGAWTQINSIKAISDGIDALAARVSANETAITDLQNKDIELNDLISGLDTDKVDKSVYDEKIEELEGLISDNKTAAENAQKAADDAQEDASANADAITTIQDAINNENTGLIKRIGDAEVAINNLDSNKVNVSDYNSKVEELNNAIEAAKKAGDDAQDAANANAEAITNIQNTIGENGLAKDIADLDSRLDTAEGKITTAEGDISDLKTRMGTAEGDISDLKTRMGTAEGKITAAEGAISTLQSDMSTAKGDIADLKQDVVDINAKIGTIPEESSATNVIDYINGQFEAANAMQYKGGIDEFSKLPITGVEAGDTYVVTADIVELVDGETISYYAGDLLIASADQGADAEYSGGWTHVVTGYQAEHNPALVGADDKIKLIALEGDGVSLGEITIETDGSALMATVADNKLSLGLQWDSF